MLRTVLLVAGAASVLGSNICLTSLQLETVTATTAEVGSPVLSILQSTVLCPGDLAMELPGPASKLQTLPHTQAVPRLF